MYALQVLSITPAKGSSFLSDYCGAQETAEAHAQASAFSMDAAAFYHLFPFHLILDKECRVLQVQSWRFRAWPSGWKQPTCFCHLFTIHLYLDKGCRVLQVSGWRCGCAVIARMGCGSDGHVLGARGLL